MRYERIRTTLGACALAGALAMSATAALNAYRPAIDQQGVSLQNVQIPSAFMGLDGKTHPPGAYELHLKQGPQGILIGLLRNGKTVAEFPGKFVPGATEPPEPDRKAGGKQQELHFDGSSQCSGTDARTLKIFPSSKRHPGGANLGSINFLLPAVQVQGK